MGRQTNMRGGCDATVVHRAAPRTAHALQRHARRPQRPSPPGAPLHDVEDHGRDNQHVDGRGHHPADDRYEQARWLRPEPQQAADSRRILWWDNLRITRCSELGRRAWPIATIRRKGKALKGRPNRQKTVAEQMRSNGSRRPLRREPVGRPARDKPIWRRRKTRGLRHSTGCFR